MFMYVCIYVYVHIDVCEYKYIKLFIFSILSSKSKSKELFQFIGKGERLLCSLVFITYFPVYVVSIWATQGDKLWCLAVTRQSMLFF